MKKLYILATLAMLSIGIVACDTSTSSSDTTNNSPIFTIKYKRKTHDKIPSSDKQSSLASASKDIPSVETAPKITSNYQTILTKLIALSDEKSSGPSKNYYWENGPAANVDYSGMHAGNFKFSSDDKGRSSTAKAVLTYHEFENSKGSRQGHPLAPPFWPHPNPKVEIHFELTGRIYHGYLFNRSHSIADSLLGKYSYTSPYNFTTGTRSQNVGANHPDYSQIQSKMAQLLL